jgi:D-alanyl-D-alanine dipeptidase
MGSALNDGPEQSNGRCYTAATNISLPARRYRRVLGHVMNAAGFINYPTEWWH